mmetsp:Transcript_16419/g.39291  ORF Transcript_16419/g.39291 Transcript_16419/m.39291 type:complete len:442 (-) Transcript_16419:167-1492(-)
MATTSNGFGKNDDGGGIGAEMKLVGAPFPPRPKAIATFLSSSDFLKGCQTLLYSAKRHLAPTPDDEYPPEIIVLLSSKVPNAAAKRKLLHPAFCDRIVHVEHIPISKDPNEASDGTKRSHVKSWDENCGWTKLRLFELDSYDTILYIDADCLVVKDVGHLLHVDEPMMPNRRPSGNVSKRVKRMGLLAAAPDIFPPDKFNAGVLVIRPSKAVFEDMMSSLENSTSNHNESVKKCKSYDGGDTGFLNYFYPGWYSDMPSYSRLPFGYNAQRFMYHCTYEKQPNYWDEAIEDIRIIHYSSSPKPWDKKAKSIGGSKDQQSYLDGKDANHIQMATHGMLENRWHEAYESSQKHMDELQKKKTLKRRSAPPQKPPATATAAAPAPPTRTKPQNTHSMVHKRYKELRKSGMSTKDAMSASRAEYGLDKADKGIDPGKSVGQMFGLM